MPERRPERKAGRHPLFKERIKSSLPSVNEGALKRLNKYEDLFADDPLTPRQSNKRVHRKITHHGVRFRCEKIIKGYSKRVASEVNENTSKMGIPPPEFWLKESLKELKEEHDFARVSVKGVALEKHYVDGTVLGTQSGSARIIIPNALGPGRAKSIRVVNPSFKSKHIFAIINGKLVALIKFQKR